MSEHHDIGVLGRPAAAWWWSYPSRLTDRVPAQYLSPACPLGGPGVINAEEWKVRMPSWRDGSARRSVIAFLQEITQGPDALPVADRVAAFDNDGTLACEKPHTALAGFLVDRAAASGSAPPEVASGHDVLRELGVLFAGQTTAQYEEQARRYLTGALHPRFQRPLPDADVPADAGTHLPVACPGLQRVHVH